MKNLLNWSFVLFFSYSASNTGALTSSQDAEGGLGLAGVVVDDIEIGSALEKAGMRSGDVLYSWEQVPELRASSKDVAGEIDSPFVWEWLLVERASQGWVALVGDRAGAHIEFQVHRESWGAGVRPQMPSTVLGAYLRGSSLIKAGELDEGFRVWRQVRKMPEVKEGSMLDHWISFQLMKALSRAKRWDQVDAIYHAMMKIDDCQVRFVVSLVFGRDSVSSGRLDSAESAFQNALSCATQVSPGGLGVATALNSLGGVDFWRGEYGLAKVHFESALVVGRQQDRAGLAVAASLNGLGNVAHEREEIDTAEGLYRQALEIRESQAPGSLAVASTLSNLGIIARRRGELEQAARFYKRALAIDEVKEPVSLGVAATLNNLGVIRYQQENLDEALEYHEKALGIRRRLEPSGLAVATSLHNIGNVLILQGAWDAAEEYFRRALKIRRERVPDSLVLAGTLHNLGNIATRRGELGRALDLHSETLRIFRESAPGSIIVATIMNSMAATSFKNGDVRGALEYHKQALSIEQMQDASSLAVARSLNNIAMVLDEMGDYGSALEYATQSLAIREVQVPSSLAVAESLSTLGIIAFSRGEIGKAEEHLESALEIRRGLKARDLSVADNYKNLGDIAAGMMGGSVLVGSERSGGKGAYDYYRRALDVLENQMSKLGGAYNSQAEFRDQYRDYYLDAMKLLLSQGLSEEGFYVLERFRAQTFLRMLTERDTAFTEDVPADLKRERRRLVSKYESAYAKLAGLSLHTGDSEIKAIRRELEKVHGEFGELESRIRFASPRLAALQYPQPLRVAEAQRMLDPGTLLLSYSVALDRITIFSLSSTEGLETMILPVREEEIRYKVERLLALVNESAPGSSVGSERLSLFLRESRAAYDILIEPFAERIEASERLLILPDGPLHALPFAALVRENDGEGRPQYLVEWKPIHISLSATVYAELKRRRRPPDEDVAQPSMQLVAFGDPVYPVLASSGSDFDAEGETEAVLDGAKAKGESAEGNSVETVGGVSMRNLVSKKRGVLLDDAVVRSAARRGVFDWQSLPYTRYEVERIASLFPGQAVRTFLGSEATEEHIKSLNSKPRILHLAAHVHADEYLPMSSFVALTIPDQSKLELENGLLQVWEIFDHIRLDADLVVLSACESGLGKELGTEGLIGLTRAFQYAGSRSVVASLWNVADRTTAELMIRFYRHLGSGLPKDEALRAAQIELIRRTIEVTGESGEPVFLDGSAPYYWAAFQVFGDWQ